MYAKQFEIRWSDIDANQHLANSAYINFMSHTRMDFLANHGFTMQELAKYAIGPVVFYEHIYYFKEAFHGQPITVGLEVDGISKDGMFFKFEHNFFNAKGDNLANCEIFGAWMNLKERKLTKLPQPLLELVDKFPKTKSFKWLTKEDTRKHNKKPVNLSI